VRVRDELPTNCVCRLTEALCLSPGQLANLTSREMQNLQPRKTAEISEAPAARRNARHKDQRLLSCDAVQSGQNMAEFHEIIYCCCALEHHKIRGKTVPLQAWSGPVGSRKSTFPDFMTTAQDGDKVVSPTHRPHLPPRNTLGTHFC
jgi:hypothetical protein